MPRAVQTVLWRGYYEEHQLYLIHADWARPRGVDESRPHFFARVSGLDSRAGGRRVTVMVVL